MYMQSQQVESMQNHQSDLETNLKIARSNLALAENHAEVLEDAIKRNSMHRMSGNGNASPITGPSIHPFHGPGSGSRPNSVISQVGGSLQRNSTTRSPNPGTAATLSAADAENERDSPSNQAPSPRLGGFWRRRPTVGAASAPNINGLAQSGTQSSSTGGKGKERMSLDGPASETSGSVSSAEKQQQQKDQHDSLMRKPSFGMLRSSSANVPSTDKERTQAAQILQLQSQISQLQHQYSLLSTEHTTLREAHAGLNQKYTSLQEEIENLSVSLFEEANTMVAEERRVNGFLNQQLEKAKEEADDLQQQLDQLRAAATLRQSTASAHSGGLPSPSASLQSSVQEADDHTRRPSDSSSILALQRSRAGSAHSRRRSVSSMSGLHHKRRRSSTIPSLDAIDALVTASPRRASRDMAAAAAAVKALATRERERESLDMPRLPATASAAGFARVNEEEDGEVERDDGAKSRSAPSSAAHAPPPPPRQREISDDTAAQPLQDGQTAEDDGTASSIAESSKGLRSKWFSFGSLSKRKSPALATDSSTLSPVIPSPNPSVVSDTGTVLDHGPSRSPPLAHYPAASSSTNRRFPSLTEGDRPHLQRSPSSRSIAESIIPLPTSPPGGSRLRTSSNRSTGTVHARIASTSSSSFKLQSPGATRPQLQQLQVAPLASTDEKGPSPRDRFFAAAAGPLAAVQSDSEAAGRGRADTSHSSQFASMTDLHSLLDEVANDIDLDVQRQAETLSGPLPFASSSASTSALQQRPPLSQRASSSSSMHSASVRSTRRPISWRREGQGQLSPSKLSQVAHSPTREEPVSPPLSDTPGSPPPGSPGSPGPHSPPTLRPRRLRPIDTSFVRTSVPPAITVPAEGNAEPLSPVLLPTPPPFKRFPTSNSYRDPMVSPPPRGASSPRSDLPRPPSSRSGAGSSHSLTRKDSPGLPSASSTSSSLNKFWDSRKLGSFGLQRQNSTVSTGGSSVVDDLDTLMQSIDAMNESLGLEGESEDGPLGDENGLNRTLRSSDNDLRYRER